MRLIKLSADHESFRTVHFNRTGVSIIASQKVTVDSKKTYNSVGKSLTIALVHFCLGASTNKNLESALPSWTFSLDFEINGTIYNSKRSTSSQKDIYLNSQKLSLKEFNKQLESEIFDIPDYSRFISFRGLIPRFIRYSKAGYVSYDRYIDKEQDATNNLNNAFLLGLSITPPLRKIELKERENNISDLKKQLRNPEFLALFDTDGSKDLEIEILEQEGFVDNLRAKIGKFIIAEDYYQIKKEADEISQRLKAQKNGATKLKIAVSNIEKSLHINPEITKEQIIKLYQDANVQLGAQVVKKLSDLEAFNKQLIENRVQRLTEEKLRFQDELDKVNLKIADLGKLEDEKLQYLNSTGALDDYSNLNQLLTDAEKKLDGLNRYRRLLSNYKVAQEEVKKDFADENINTDGYLESARELIRSNIILFKSFVEKFYSDKFSGITITNNEAKNSIRYDIKAKIQDDAGGAVGEVKIFCYDWTILKGRHGHRMKLLFHDSKITADMDTRQVKTMLDIAYRECEVNDFQYIISLNQNTIDSLKGEMTDEEHQRLVLERVILNLSDKSQQDKLLGIQVDLEYDS